MIIRRLATAAALAAPLALLGAAAPATAAHTAGGQLPAFDFADCPNMLPVGADPAKWFCDEIVITGGSMKIGSIDQTLTVPIHETYIVGPAKGGGNQFIFAKLTADPQPIDGGVIGIPGSDKVFPILKLSVRPVFVGNFHFGLPTSTENLRFKVINTFLPDTCSIGTDQAPIAFNLTVTPGTLKFYPPTSNPQKLTVTGATLADSSYAVPGAGGCGLLDGIANFRAGLPSAAGKNNTSFTTFIAGKKYSDLFPALRKARH